MHYASCSSLFCFVLIFRMKRFAFNEKKKLCEGIMQISPASMKGSLWILWQAWCCEWHELEANGLLSWWQRWWLWSSIKSVCGFGPWLQWQSLSPRRQFFNELFYVFRPFHPFTLPVSMSKPCYEQFFPLFHTQKGMKSIAHKKNSSFFAWVQDCLKSALCHASELSEHQFFKVFSRNIVSFSFWANKVSIWHARATSIV